MKMKFKLTSIILAIALVLCQTTAFAALTESDIDYSSQLSQIKALMSRCDAAGISYPYEAINYKTIERFETYIKQDIANGVSTDAMNTFNKSEVDALCSQTISNLNAYLNGTKTPYNVSLPDMSEVTADGNGGLVDGDDTPVIAMGYGCESTVINDMQNLNDFGADIIQIELGQSRAQSFTSPLTVESVGNAAYTEKFDPSTQHSGQFSLKYVTTSAATGNVYIRPNLTKKCKPNTAYKYGAYVKYNSNYTNGLNIYERITWGGDSSEYIQIKSASGSGSASSDWTYYENTYVTGANQTTLELFFVIEGQATVWLDDIFISEGSSVDNLIENGDLDGNGAIGPFNPVRHNNADATMRVSRDDKHSGEQSLRVENNSPASSNVFIQPTQTVYCKPNTTYEFGGYVKYETNHTNGANISIRTGWSGNTYATVYSGRGEGSASGDWSLCSGSFTTGADQFSFDFFIVVEGEAVAYFDDMYVKEAGTNKNMLIDGDCEDGRINNDTFQVMRALQKGETYNVAVSILVSPAYMPENIDNVDIINTGDDTYAFTFIKYNINEPNALLVVENYIRNQLMPRIVGYSSLSDICLANEVAFRAERFVNFYQPLFRNWIMEKHGSLSAINTAYGTSYSSINSISMPTPLTYTKESNIPTSFYDYVVFNQEILRDWQIWMKDIVRDYSDLPIHTKAYFANMRWDTEHYRRYNLANGADIEMFDEFSDYAGMDQSDWIEDAMSYWQSMMYYDYLYSVTGKPIFNSETHTISDGYQTYDAKVAKHTKNHLWMASTRGGSMYTHWIWAHGYASGNSSSNSLLTRPAVVAGIGHTGLDVLRLSDDVKKIRDGGSQTKKVALFYSKPSRSYNIYHTYMNFRAYQALVNAGVKVGFVSESCLDQLSKYDAVILADVTNGTTTAMNAIKNYAANGGKVLAMRKTSSGYPFSKTEYNQSRTGITSYTNVTSQYVSFSRNGNYSYSLSDAIFSQVTNFVKNNGLTPVTVTDSSGNALTCLDWSYYYDGNQLLINVTNVDKDNYSTAKNAKFYLNGTQLTGMTDLISGDENLSTVSLSCYEPRLLEYGAEVVASISNRAVNRNTRRITWSTTEGAYKGADVYKYENGEYTKVYSGKKNMYYEYSVPGTYIVVDSGDENLDNAQKLYAVIPDAIDLAFTNTSISDKFAIANVTATNTINAKLDCVIKVEVLDANGNVITYHYQTLVLDPEAVNSFRVCLPVKNNAQSIKLSAVDSKELGNKIADNVIYNAQ